MDQYVVFDGRMCFGPFPSENAAHDWVSENREKLAVQYPDVLCLWNPTVVNSL